MGIIAMWLAFTLRLDTMHWPSGLQWLVYVMGPALALPIFIRMGLYRAIFRYTGMAALITTGKAVALYGAILLSILLAAQWEGVPRSVGVLQPVILLLMVGASRALGWFWLAGRPENATHRLLIYGAGNAGAQTAAAMEQDDRRTRPVIVGPDHGRVRFQQGPAGFERVHQHPCAVPILHVGGGDLHCQQIAHGVYQDVSLSSCNFLARIIAT